MVSPAKGPAPIYQELNKELGSKKDLDWVTENNECIAKVKLNNEEAKKFKNILTKFSGRLEQEGDLYIIHVPRDKIPGSYIKPDKLPGLPDDLWKEIIKSGSPKDRTAARGTSKTLQVEEVEIAKQEASAYIEEIVSSVPADKQGLIKTLRNIVNTSDFKDVKPKDRMDYIKKEACHILNLKGDFGVGRKPPEFILKSKVILQLVMETVPEDVWSSNIKQFSRALLNDKEFVKAVAAKAGLEVLQYSSKISSNDPDIWRVANLERVLFRQIPERLRNDREVIKNYLSHSARSLMDATPAEKDDPELVEIAIKSSTVALEYASARLKADPKMILIAAARFMAYYPSEFDKRFDKLDFVPQNLKESPEFRQAVKNESEQYRRKSEQKHLAEQEQRRGILGNDSEPRLKDGYYEPSKNKKSFLIKDMLEE